jgi:basic membrane protein A
VEGNPLRQLVNPRLRLVAALAAVTLGLAACGGSDDGGSGTDTAAPEAGDLKDGLAYDIGGRGDQSFNDSAALGLDKAKDELGLEATESEAGAGEAESAKEERLRVLADSGHNPVIAVGFAYSGSVAKVAPEFPEVDFAIVDDAVEGENISNLLFAEHEGSFLVGAAAALTSKTGNVGFIGGVQVPLIEKFEVGFTEGAQAVKPDIEVQTVYLTQAPDFSGFTDPAKGRTAAQGMFDGGADVVYHAAGGSGGGLFEAAKAAGGLAIGVDSDQYETAAPDVKDVILTSMVKRVDVAVFDFLSRAAEGELEAGPIVYDLEQGGIDYSTSGGKVDGIRAQLDEYKQKIVDGEIEVTDPTA